MIDYCCWVLGYIKLLLQFYVVAKEFLKLVIMSANVT